MKKEKSSTFPDEILDQPNELEKASQDNVLAIMGPQFEEFNKIIFKQLPILNDLRMRLTELNISADKGVIIDYLSGGKLAMDLYRQAEDSEFESIGLRSNNITGRLKDKLRSDIIEVFQPMKELKVSFEGAHKHSFYQHPYKFSTCEVFDFDLCETIGIDPLALERIKNEKYSIVLKNESQAKAYAIGKEAAERITDLLKIFELSMPKDIPGFVSYPNNPIEMLFDIDSNGKVLFNFICLNELK